MWGTYWKIVAEGKIGEIPHIIEYKRWNTNVARVEKDKETSMHDIENATRAINNRHPKIMLTKTAKIAIHNNNEQPL